MNTVKILDREVEVAAPKSTQIPRGRTATAQSGVPNPWIVQMPPANIYSNNTTTGPNAL